MSALDRQLCLDHQPGMRFGPSVQTLPIVQRSAPLLLSIFVLFILFMPECVKNCPTQYSTTTLGGLRKHQKRCTGYQDFERKTAERRKAIAPNVRDRLRGLGATLPERKARLLKQQGQASIVNIFFVNNLSPGS